jgi:hypothetical protein
MHQFSILSLNVGYKVNSSGVEFLIADPTTTAILDLRLPVTCHGTFTIIVRKPVLLNMSIAVGSRHISACRVPLVCGKQGHKELSYACNGCPLRADMDEVAFRLAVL